jgi:hypothetical protein
MIILPRLLISEAQRQEIIAVNDTSVELSKVEPTGLCAERIVSQQPLTEWRCVIGVNSN